MPSITASFTDSEDILPLDVSLDLTLNDLLAYIAAETDKDTTSLVITHNGTTLDSTTQGTTTLQSLGFTGDDLISISPKSQPVQPSAGNSLPDAAYESFRLNLLQNREMLSTLTTLQPQLAQAVHDPSLFKQLIEPLVQSGLLSAGGAGPAMMAGPPGGCSPEEWRQLMANPDTRENKEKIESYKAIQESFEFAHENTPEVFGSVTMLYVNLKVNGTPVKAFVDSGAQATIMSSELAKKCGIHHLIDKRFSGIAQGVGSGKILGRVHSAQLQVENLFLSCSFTILDSGVDMLLGLDTLRRYQGCIDLKRNVLVLDEAETPFLGEAEIPKGMFEAALGGQPLQSGSQSVPGRSAKSAAAEAAAKRFQNHPVQAAAATSRPAAPLPSTTHPESSITQLMALGFSRGEAIQALNAANGNVDMAASMLF